MISQGDVSKNWVWGGWNEQGAQSDSGLGAFFFVVGLFSGGVVKERLFPFQCWLTLNMGQSSGVRASLTKAQQRQVSWVFCPDTSMETKSSANH